MGLPPPGHFIALGSKSRVNSSEQDPKVPQPLSRKPTQSAAIISSQASTVLKEKRKDFPATLSLSSPSLQKQAKFPSGLFSPTPGKTKHSPQGARLFENDSPCPPVILIEASPVDLEASVLEASSMNQTEQVEGYICAALKTLKLNRLKPDPMLYLTIIGLAKARPELFLLRGVTEHLLMFLKRETSASAVKPKPNPLLTSMACNVLVHVYQNEDSWPHSFIKVFVEDALGDRSWVDNEHCKPFVDNILMSFGTVLPTKPTTGDQSKKETQSVSIGNLSTTIPQTSDEEKILEEFGITVEGDEPVSVMARYSSPTMESAVQYYIQDVVKEQLNKRQMIDGVSRNMLRFLTSVCGYPEVRLVASQKMEAWLQNPKLTRPAQELLMSVALNCNTHTSDDIDVIGNLVKMRLKTKPLANHYISCIKELVNQHPDNLGTTLKHVIYNELGQQRNSNNMAILQVIFQIEPENAAKYLALVIHDLLTNREDYLKALKALFREIVRVLRFEINFVAFCRGLMQERSDSYFLELDQGMKDRIFSSLVSLICLTMMVSVSPAVKEIALAMGRGERRDLSVLQEFQTQISMIQRDAVWWFYSKVLSMLNPSEKDFISSLNKVLFLESIESYQSKDSWPSENEATFLWTLLQDVPLTEDALLRLLLLGLSEDFPMNCTDTIDIVERLVQRSAVLRTGLQGIEIERQTVMEMVLSLCAYSHPKEISLPQGYQPPQLAISSLYWKGWTVLIILAACNPVTIGLAVWQSYPTARCMVEMIITRNYSFPPLANAESTIDEIKAAELQLSRAEKEEILVFESHLAAATNGKVITEENSLLVNQLLSLDPSGPPRRPPQATIDHLKMLNKSLGLDYMFCKSRNPDFLLDIIHSQGSTRSMPWLADLVQSSESSLTVLPSQCLCEFLLMKDEKVKPQKRTHAATETKLVHARVVERLQSLLKGEEATEISTREIMEYFFNRLQSHDMKERDNAVKALDTILNAPVDNDLDSAMAVDDNDIIDAEYFKGYRWLLKQASLLEYFDALLPSLNFTIRQAMYREMDTTRLQAYILFASRHADIMTKEELSDLAEDVSQLVTTRETLLNGLVNPQLPQGIKTYQALLQLYTCALEKSLESGDVSLQWSSDQEKVHVSWSAGTLHDSMSASLHVRIIHASIVLLTCCPLSDPDAGYDWLLSTWFPDTGQYEVRLADTGEEAVILHDWLRMKMVRSGVPKLVNAALTGLVPAQLVLFMQTFGLPVASVSHLLKALDEAAVSEPTELSQAIVDRDYLYQLVEIHWARGATGGKSLSEFLGQDGAQMKQDSYDLDMLEESISPFSIHVNSPEYMKEDIKRPIIFDKNMLQQLLIKLYSEEDVKRDAVDAFSELKKVIAVSAVCEAKDKTAIVALIDAFDEILHSEKKEKFIASLYQKSEKTCTILNLLSKAKEYLEATSKEKLFILLKSIWTKQHEGSKVHSLVSSIALKCGLAIDQESKEPIGSELRNALAELLKESSKPVLQMLSLRVAHLLSEAVRSRSLTRKDIDIQVMLEACRLMQEMGLSVFKKFVDTLCHFFINDDSTNKFDDVKDCVQLLVELYKHGSSLANDFSTGFILDWLEILDPEIVHVDPLLQRDSLFMDRQEISTHDPDVKETNSSSSAYLRSLLSHQCSDRTLFDCLDWLLSVDIKSSRLNPSAALDLISSVVFNPKQWQGRDSKQNCLDEDKGRRIDDEVTLDFSLPQLCKLVELILAEMEIFYQPTKVRPEPTSSRKAESEKLKTQAPIPAAILNIAEKRLPLLLNHVKAISSKKMEKVAANVRRMKKFPRPIVSCLLNQIYLLQPNLLSMSMQEMLNKESADRILQGESCSADDFINTLMLSVANTKPDSIWQDKFHNLILLCRRLTVKHPLLVLRHLQTMLSVVQGRHRLGSSAFSNTNQLMLFTQVLSLLDLLRPYIFLQTPVAQDGLKLSIHVYIDLIQSDCLNGSEAASIVTKFVEFLNNFVAFDSSYAFAVLSPEFSFLRDLSNDHSTFVGIKFLCTFLSIGEDDVDAEHRIFSTPVIPSLCSPWTERQLSLLRQKFFDTHDKEAVSKVLLDLDETSKRRVDILQHFLEELVTLLYSEFSEIRIKAHNLLLRHYRSQPRDTESLIDAYMKALSSEDQIVALSAAKFLPQVILLADDGSHSLLTKLFRVMTLSRFEAKEFILQSMKNLNIEL